MTASMKILLLPCLGLMLLGLGCQMETATPDAATAAPPAQADTTDVEARLAELGITLPNPPAPPSA